MRLACWKTMPRSAPGEVIARPSTVTWPELGFSKPAIIFWSVDFPQPEGPSRQRNSFFSTDSVMSSSAMTSVLRFRSRKVLLTFEIWIVAISALPALDRGVALPVQHARHQRTNGQVAEKAEQTDAGHGGEHEVITQEIIGIPEHVAEAALHRYQFPRHGQHPRRPDANAQAGKYAGQRRRQNDVAQQLPLAAANHGAGPDQIPVATLHTMNGAHPHREKRAEKHQEDRRFVGDAKPDDGEGNPRHRWNRTQHLECRLDDGFDPSGPADSHTQRHRKRGCDAEASHHAGDAGRGIENPPAPVALRIAGHRDH